jgi:hypothetical protein
MKANRRYKTMRYYKIKYADDTFNIVKAGTMLEVIRRYDLCTKEHVGTRVIELEGEQAAIAQANEEVK